MTLKSLSQYGPHFQVKVLNSLLKNKKFTLNIRDVILPSFFENQAHQWIVKDKRYVKPFLNNFNNTLNKFYFDFYSIDIE